MYAGNWPLFPAGETLKKPQNSAVELKQITKLSQNRDKDLYIHSRFQEAKVRFAVVKFSKISGILCDSKVKFSADKNVLNPRISGNYLVQ